LITTCHDQEAAVEPTSQSTDPRAGQAAHDREVTEPQQLPGLICPERPMDTSDIDPETGEAFGVDPDAYDCEVT
jgi:hypothetical protein